VQYQVKDHPDVEPITLSEAKAYLKVEHDAEDVLITHLITAARQYVEGQYGYALITQTITAGYNSWKLRLPLSNAIDVVSVSYYNASNVLTAIDSDDYNLDAIGKPNCITFAEGFIFPTVYDRSTPIVVEYTAGYGENVADVPKADVIPIYKVLAEWYEDREDKPWEKLTASRFLIRQRQIWSF